MVIPSNFIYLCHYIIPFHECLIVNIKKNAR
uniref:Uncharacterized protein n=1 Tax=Rhizophora mucronata TaxID=61149 RepID=A0A2P2QJU1_RHIMU